MGDFNRTGRKLFRSVIQTLGRIKLSYSILVHFLRLQLLAFTKILISFLSIGCKSRKKE